MALSDVRVNEHELLALARIQGVAVIGVLEMFSLAKKRANSCHVPFSRYSSEKRGSPSLPLRN